MVRISEVSGYWMEDDSPLITIAGAWLKEYGFEIGCKVVLDITEGQIIIKRVDVVE